MTELRASLFAHLDRTVDGAWLGAFRMLFGAAMCISMLRFIVYGWIDPFFVTPRFHFKYYGFEWLEPLSRVGMHALFWTLAGLALSIALGLWFRAATWLFVLGFSYLQLVDVTTYLNHYYLASLLGILLALSPADRWGSVHRGRKSERTPGQIPLAWLYLFRLQVGTVYTFAGLAKANADGLIHAQPLRIWLASRTDLPLIGALFKLDGAALVMSWTGFLFDVCVPWLLLIPRVRPFAFGAVISFHLLTRLLFPIGMFPVIMVLSALVFFSPSWPRRLLARPKRPTGPALIHSEPPRARQPRWVLAAMLLYCCVQVALPLRFLAYGGNVRWHEQGMRFSWRVMVREKNGSVTFVVRQKTTGRSWYVSPHAYLTRAQEREMSGQPDLVLQLSHYIRDDYERRGFGAVEVRADALVSLNGRRMRRLIDANIDLAAISDGVERADWILPAPKDAPPHITPI